MDEIINFDDIKIDDINIDDISNVDLSLLLNEGGDLPNINDEKEITPVDFDLLLNEEGDHPNLNDEKKITSIIDDESNDAMTYSEIFDVNVPIVGQISQEELNKHNSPFIKNYDLAKVRNECRLRYQIQTGEYHAKSNRVTRKQISQDKSAQYDPNNSTTKEIQNLNTGVWLLQMFSTAMRNLTTDQDADFEKAISVFETIDQRAITARSIILAYPIVNLIGKCRFHKDKRVKQWAMKLYMKFQAMFPVMDGETFEATFAKEVMSQQKTSKRED